MIDLARRLRPLGFSLLAVAACGAATAASGIAGASILQARDGRGELTAHVVDGTVTLESSSGIEAALSFPRGGRLHSLVALDGGWLAAGSRQTAAGRELMLFGRIDGARIDLRTPATRARLRINPNLLVADGELVGLLWLEGPDRRQLALRSSRWTGNGWTAAETLADTAPGSQLALQAAVLNDGTWLAVWSRYDGEDDEIFWTRHNKTGWSAPRRIYKNNSTPDITPTLVPLEEGAVVAWSRYDGNDYRVVTTRYRAGSWNVPQMIGERGSVFPTLLERHGRAFLFYRATIPAEWTLLELSSSAAIQRRATLPVERRDAPEVVIDSDSAARLRWTDGAGGEETRSLSWR